MFVWGKRNERCKKYKNKFKSMRDVRLGEKEGYPCTELTKGG